MNKFQLNAFLLLCISVEFFLSFVASQIPLDSKLSVAGSKSWVSSNGDFALGFCSRSDQINQYSVGIRFNSKSIPASKQTMVWVVGGDVSVGNASYFHLSKDGDLVLFDSSQGFNVWSSRTSKLSVASASLLNNGNFVLLNETQDIVWQSFDTPSDTLLPGQNFSVFRTLRAASKNSISSYYSLYMNDSGQLQLRWETSVIYWHSGNPPKSNVSAVLTSSGALRLLDERLVPIWSAFGEDHNDPVNFRFLRLDVDGNLRLYSWVEDTKSWVSVWQAVKNQCDVFATCGEQGVCVFNASGTPACKCPFTSASKGDKKCLLSYREGCKAGSLFVLEHTYLYGIYPPNDSIIRSNLQDCRSRCLSNPFCAAVTFTNDGSAECRMKMTQYVSGYSDPALSSVSFIRKCLDLDPIAVDPDFLDPPPLSNTSYRLCIPCLIGVSTGTLVTVVLIQFAVGLYIYRRRISALKKAALAYKDPGSNSLVKISFAELKDITENFKHHIGPNMFRGVLPDKQLVVVKEMEINIPERKFRAAVLKTGSIHHKNLAKLKGYCCELSYRYLVYEHAKYVSLDRCLKDSKLRKGLTWKKRVDICSSVARAICYLHTGCREFMSHGNLTCENVFMDDHFEAKVAEFGLGILSEEGSETISSAEKDIEDFGKLVLTLISGCQSIEGVIEGAYDEWMGGRFEWVIDKDIGSGVNAEELERALRIAFWCLQSDDRLRPSMAEVVKVLEGTLSVDPPPPPFACGRHLDEEELIGSEP